MSDSPCSAKTRFSRTQISLNNIFVENCMFSYKTSQFVSIAKIIIKIYFEFDTPRNLFMFTIFWEKKKILIPRQSAN